MMDEELHLQPAQTAGIFRGAVVITVATLVGHLCAPSRCGGSAGRATGAAARPDRGSGPSGES
jgi:hypothetical protein